MKIKDLVNAVKYGEVYKFNEVHRIEDEKKDIFYIIRRRSPGEGFFSNYFYVLAHIMYGHKKGWKCVVDMKNYQTLYSESITYDETDNAWEYYFEQPDGVCVEAAYHSKNYVLSDGCYHSEMGVPVFEIEQGFLVDSMIDNLYQQQHAYIRIKQKLYDEFQQFYMERMNGKKWIGVHVRGTDMKIKQEKHTIPPGIEKVFEQIDRLIVADGKIGIFLCCDEKRTIELFVERYGNRCLYNDVFRSENLSDIGIHMQKSSRKYHHFLLGKEVLADCVLLSKCDYLICGISNVTNAAILLNNHKYIEKIVNK